MTPQVWAAIVTSSVALVVAVIGIWSTGRAQTRGTDRAHRDALDLFKEQTAVQERARQQEAAERRRLADLDHRRETYARFDAAAQRWSSALRDLKNAEYKDDEQTFDGERWLVASDVYAAAKQEVDELWPALMIVAPDEVTGAAQHYRFAVAENTDTREPRLEFIRMVRIDLCVVPERGPEQDLNPGNEGE